MTGSPDAAPTPLKALGADTPPTVGDRVRVIVEGTVGAGAGSDLWLVPDDGRYGGQRFNPNWPYVVSVEVLTPPAPTYKAGDVVLDAQGRVAEYVGIFTDGTIEWWQRFGGSQVSDDLLARPLTLLVRAGKSVSP